MSATIPVMRDESMAYLDTLAEADFIAPAPPKQYCSVCHKALSRYNYTGMCFCHQQLPRFEEYLDNPSTSLRRRNTSPIVQVTPSPAVTAPVSQIQPPPKPKSLTVADLHLVSRPSPASRRRKSGPAPMPDEAIYAILDEPLSARNSYIADRHKVSMSTVQAIRSGEKKPRFFRPQDEKLVAAYKAARHAKLRRAAIPDAIIYRALDTIPSFRNTQLAPLLGLAVHDVRAIRRGTLKPRQPRKGDEAKVRRYLAEQKSRTPKLRTPDEVIYSILDAPFSESATSISRKLKVSNQFVSGVRCGRYRAKVERVGDAQRVQEYSERRHHRWNQAEILLRAGHGVDYCAHELRCSKEFISKVRAGMPALRRQA